MQRLTIAMFTVIALACSTACGGSDHQGNNQGPDDYNAFSEVAKAICVLTPTNNEQLPAVTGIITLTQTKSGVLVQANITGLRPNAKHGFHVHQWGNIAAPDGAAAGGHYDPTGEPHAMTVGHPGDLGNLESDDTGSANYSKTFEDISLTGYHAIIGRSIIVHLNEDNNEQPAGNAGPRVAQGVIGIANPE